MALMRLVAGWAVLALAVVVVPAAAQEQPVPLTYPEEGIAVRPDPAKPPEMRAKEQAKAETAQAACTAGDAAGCTALGLAYMVGEGRPQNRPVAELLLRDACAANSAQGCYALGNLLLSVNDFSVFGAAAGFYAQGCEGGSRDACDALADYYEARESQLTPGIDRTAEIARLRRETCDAGSRSACRKLAETAIGEDSPPAQQAQGKATLEGYCREGDREACTVLTAHVITRDEQDMPVPTPHAREVLAWGCRAGDGLHCAELSRIVFAGGSGPPAQRVEALALLDRACQIDETTCKQAKAIRTAPALAESCAQNVQADCAALGELYSDSTSLIFAPEEALRLLGQACDAGTIAACASAAMLLRYDFERRDAQSIAATERWLTRACDAGGLNGCALLGVMLVDGNYLAPDRARGLELLSAACDSGDSTGCTFLSSRAGSEPDVPVQAADAQFVPPMTAEEEAAFYAEQAARAEAEYRERRALFCTTTEVLFRAVTYTDTVCEEPPAAIGGFRIQPGGAPWQALLWRPQIMNGRTLDSRQRVECGGALIRHGWVLTAAHCIVDAKKNLRLTPGHRVRLGLTTPGNAEGVSYPILRAIPHPMYHERSRAFDIALIQLDPGKGKRETTVQNIATIRLDPQPLDQRPVKGGMPVYVYGWGLTSVGGEASDYLKGVKLSLEDPVTCSQRNKFTGRLLGSALLCASAPDRSQACNGDSGGPLVTYGDADRIPTVIGVVSAGEECGTTGIPSRYTRVAKVRDWLDQTMGPRPGTPARASRGR